MAITGKIQDAAAAALSAIEEALDLNEPEAAGKDAKSDEAQIRQAQHRGRHERRRSAPPVRRRQGGRRVRQEGRHRRLDTNPTLNLQLPRPAKPADKGAARPADKPADKPAAKPSTATRPAKPAAVGAKAGGLPTPRSPAPGFSTPAKPASGFAPAPKPAVRARAKARCARAETRRGARAKTGEARADDAARQRRPPQHRRVARRAELPPERNDHRHDGAVDHRLDGAVDALCLFPSRKHFGRGRQFSRADADTDAARAVRADRVPVRHRHHGPPRA